METKTVRYNFHPAMDARPMTFLDVVEVTSSYSKGGGELLDTLTKADGTVVTVKSDWF